MKAVKILLKTAGGLLILLIIALGCALCWLYSWTWRGELSNFHESWTPDERAALTRLDSYLRHQWVRDAFSPIPISPDAKKTKEEEEMPLERVLFLEMDNNNLVSSTMYFHSR